MTRGGSRIFLGRGALVSCSTSTPINHIVFFVFAEYQLYYKTAGHLRGGCTPPAPPLDPPLVTQKEYSLNLENHCSPVSVKLLFHCFPHKGSQLPFQSLSLQGNPLRINSCSSLLVM